MFLTFDTETTGLPKNFKAEVSDSENWPRLVQIAWQLNNEKGELLSNNSLIIKPEGFTIPFNSEKIHGISTEIASNNGIDLKEAILKFEKGNSIEISEKMSEFNKNRKKSQPTGIYNAGSVFKNTKEYFAGELIEKAGLKGYSINNVSVSNKHANFFIAKKGAKALSLYKLVQHVKEKVNDKYGVMLEEEIQFIGEFN